LRKKSKALLYSQIATGVEERYRGTGRKRII